MGTWEKAVNLTDLKIGSMINVKLNGQNILLVHIENTVYALLNDCPHLGCFLHKGKLVEFELTCPCHDWTFDVRTGDFLVAPEISIPVFPVKVENGEVYLELEEM